MELFKYMPYREDFFENRLLRFTPALFFNDPFEGQMTKSSICSTLQGAIRKYNGASWVPMAKEDIEREYVPNSLHCLGILTLTRTQHSLLMWAHYANSHEGIILGVDSTHPFFNQTISPREKPPLDSNLGINVSLLGKVVPVNYERVRIEMKAKDHIGSFAELLQKSEEWIYEKEYRMFMRISDCDQVVDDKNGNKLVHLFKLPEEAVTRIVMGVRSDKTKILKDFENALKVNPKLSHIKLESAELHKDLYHIEHLPVQLRYNPEA